MGEMLKELREANPQAAKKIEAAQQCPPKKPLKIVRLAHSFGVESLPAAHAGALRRSHLLQHEDGEDSGYYITTNEDDPKTRRRFTIAHELAHFLLHKEDIGEGFPENALFRRPLSNRKEVEANKLAADILMPYDKIDALIDEVGKDIGIEDIATA